MAQLVIRGHAKRGKEVIEILEMLGGKMFPKSTGTNPFSNYFINNNGHILYYPYDYILSNLSYDCNDDVIEYTLEEFLEKFPYKVGDKVQKTICGSVYIIEQMKWEDNQVKYIICDLYWKNCKCTVTSKDLQPYNKKETMEEKLMPKIDFSKYCKDKYLLDIGDYEIKVEDGKTYMVKKKPKYPKSYKECCDVLGLCTMDNDAKGYKHELIIRFQELLIARDAYWKIGGDWKPNLNSKQHKFAISNVGNKISFEVYGEYNSILCFPTEEMRDAFFGNFKKEIEECKEFL